MDESPASQISWLQWMHLAGDKTKNSWGKIRALFGLLRTQGLMQGNNEINKLSQCLMLV